jgi:hypothetical protein
MKSVAVTGTVYMADRFRNVEYDLVKQIWRNARRADDNLEGFWAFRNGMITIDGIAKAHGANTLIVTPFWSFRGNETTARLARMTKDAANAAGIPLLDAANLMPAGDVSMVVDDVHFSAKGSAMFASLLADAIVAKNLLDMQNE